MCRTGMTYALSDGVFKYILGTVKSAGILKDLFNAVLRMQVFRDHGGQGYDNWFLFVCVTVDRGRFVVVHDKTYRVDLSHQPW